MLVKVRGDDPSRLSSTERTVVNWLKSWTGAHALPGIAVVKSDSADVIVWTPKTCVVVVLKGFTERVNGTLVCAAAEPWTIEGQVAPLEGVQTGTEPMEEVNTRTRALEHELRSAPGRESVAVTGIVLVIPQLGTRIALEKGPLPSGVDVVVGDGPSSLRAYFNRIAGDESGTNPAPADTWDAAQVGQALGTLGFAAAATYSDLIAEGFPAPTDRGRSREPAPAVAAQPAPAAATPSGPAAPMSNVPLTGSAPRPRPQQPPPPQQPMPQQQQQPGPPREFAPPPGFPQNRPPQQQQQQQSESFSAAAPYPTQAQPYSVPFDPRPEPAPPRRRGRGVVPLVLLAFLVIVLVLAATCTGGGNSKHPSTGPAATTSEPDPFTKPTGTTTPDPTIPSDTIAPACYPLQPCPGR